MTTLRPARPDDHDVIVALPGLSPSTRRLLARDLAGELPRHALVAEDNGVVGFAMATRQPDQVHLLDLVVASGHRRDGLGARLVVGLARLARADGATAMTLEVRVDNVAARGLYRSLAFTDAGARPGYYRDGEDARILWHHDLSTLAAVAGPDDVPVPTLGVEAS